MFGLQYYFMTNVFCFQFALKSQVLELYVFQSPENFVQMHKS